MLIEICQHSKSMFFVQVVKKVDTVFKVGLPIAKWLHCICLDALQWTCLAYMIPLKTLNWELVYTDILQRLDKEGCGEVTLAHFIQTCTRDPIIRWEKRRAHFMYLIPKFCHLSLGGKKFPRKLLHLMSHTPRQSLLAWHEESKVVWRWIKKRGNKRIFIFMLLKHIPGGRVR